MSLNKDPIVRTRTAWLRSIGWVAGINLLLAAAALGKDILFAAYFGTSKIGDIWFLSSFIPDTLGNNLLASAMIVAAVPIFARLVRGAPGPFRRADRQMKTILLIFAGVLITAVFLMRNEVLGLVAGQLNPVQQRIGITILTIALPTVLLFPWAYIGMARLQAARKFAAAAFTPVLFNGALLGGILFCLRKGLPSTEGVRILAIAWLLGGIVMTLWVAATFLRRPRETVGGPIAEPANIQEAQRRDWLDFIRLFLPYLGMLLIVQWMLWVERALAARLSPGSVSGLNYAFRIAQFPTWVFVAALAAVVFPGMADAWNENRPESFRSSVDRALRFTLLIGIPMTIILFGLREPVISTLFMRGAFNRHSLMVTDGILAGYALVIIGQSINMVLIRVFLAMGRPASLLLAAGVGTGVNLLFDLSMIGRFGAPALGFGAALGAVATSSVLLVQLRRHLGSPMEWLSFRFWGQIIGANLPMILPVGLGMLLWRRMGLLGRGTISLAFLAGIGLLAVLVYGISLRLSGIDRWIKDSR